MLSDGDARAGAVPGRRLVANRLPLVALFGGTLFLSALLLFSVQPLFAKMVLPRLGGTPAVWSVAMVFFQAMLLAGYAYAHILVSVAGLRRAVVIHAAIMAAALFWLPIGIAEGFEHPPESGLPFWLLILFATSIGVPFFAVAANAPLLQAWFSRTGHPHAADPYFLYGASNLGSFFALLSYPVAIEPLLRLGDQSLVWARLDLLLAVCVTLCGVVAMRGAEPAAAGPTPGLADLVSWRDRARWVALAALPSALLVAVTAHLTTNIAAAPFLWVLPLALFLLTFVLAFQRQPVLPPRFVELMAPVAVVAAIFTCAFPAELGGLPGIAINLAAFFLIALAWHSALAARRPAAARLTEFYLFMSVGGVLGGAFTSLAAPVVFQSVAEFPLLLALALLIVPEARDLLRGRLADPVAAFLLIAVAFAYVWSGVEYRERSFFGVVSTRLVDGGLRVLVHGTTVHGAERIADLERRGQRPTPLTYYAEGGPLAGAIALEQARHDVLQVGVVGLGIGSLACYGRPGETWRFYEIDPAVIAAARNRELFTFLSACAPEAPIVPGDARLSLAEETDAYDVLVIDAFSSDSIPVHLLTREALALYAERVAPDGIVLVHISNQFMELASVIAAGAAEEGLTAARMVHLRSKKEAAEQKLSSEAVVLARDPARIEAYLGAGWTPLRPSADVGAWTDDYSNVMGAILRKQGLL